MNISSVAILTFCLYWSEVNCFSITSNSVINSVREASINSNLPIHAGRHLSYCKTSTKTYLANDISEESAEVAEDVEAEDEEVEDVEVKDEEEDINEDKEVSFTVIYGRTEDGNADEAEGEEESEQMLMDKKMMQMAIQMAQSRYV